MDSFRFPGYYIEGGFIMQQWYADSYLRRLILDSFRFPGDYRGGIQCAAAGRWERDAAPLGGHQQQGPHPPVSHQERWEQSYGSDSIVTGSSQSGKTISGSCLKNRHFYAMFFHSFSVCMIFYAIKPGFNPDPGPEFGKKFPKIFLNIRMRIPFCIFIFICRSSIYSTGTYLCSNFIAR